MARKNSGSIASVLLAVALLLTALTFAQVAGYLAGPTQDVSAQAAALGEPNDAALQAHLEESKETVETLKKTNLFVKPAPKEHPVKQVDGILGTEILVGDKWYKVGDKIGDATVIAIKSTEVMIEWDGQTKSFAPLAAATGGTVGPSTKPAPAVAKAPAAVGPVIKPEAVQVVQAVAEEDPLAWLGVSLSGRMRELLMEKWSSASPEDRERAKEEWNKMSDEQKEQAVAAMERMQ